MRFTPAMDGTYERAGTVNRAASKLLDSLLDELDLP